VPPSAAENRELAPKRYVFVMKLCDGGVSGDWAQTHWTIMLRRVCIGHQCPEPAGTDDPDIGEFKSG